MKMLQLAIGSLLVSAAMTGCMNPGQVTGGGKVIDSKGKVIANFGMNADTCSGDLMNPEGHFNWVDKAAGVKMSGQLEMAAQCVDEEDWQGTWYGEECAVACVPLFGYGTYVAKVSYRSTNPAKPGSGYALACLKDNGEGIKKIDGDKVALFAGPGVFAGYTAIGTVRGNVQSHTCDVIE